MKIGIMTFWWSNDNYGQLLQCYALQKYLRDRGHDAFLIRYNYENDIKKTPILLKLLKACNPILLRKFLSNKKRLSKVQNEQIKNDRCFDEFRKKYIPFSEIEYASYEDLEKNPPEADCYIVGSDQVWNYWAMRLWRFRNPLHAYFLDFGSEKIKRLSYAASWGRTDISEEYRKEIKPLLKNFDYIGVREQSGIDLCTKCGRNDAEWVCDPTLLLSAEKYRELYQSEQIRKPQGKYLLLYMLNNQFSFDIQKIYEFAKSKELEIVYVTGNGVIDERKKYFATIPEWLYLVDNAEYVITNSFHCGVFSTIFHKQFGIVPLSGNAIGMNVRFESLFELRETGNRFVTDDDFSVLEKEFDAKDIQISKRFLDAISDIDNSLVFNIYTENGDHQLLIDNTPDGFRCYLELLSIFEDVDYKTHKINMKLPLRMTQEMKTKVSDFTKKVSVVNKEIFKIEKIIRDIPLNQYFIIFPYKMEDKLEIMQWFEYLDAINNNVSKEEYKKNAEQLKKDFNTSFLELSQIYDFITFSTRVQQSIGIKDKNKRVCRFCGRSINEGAKFKEKAHAISESIGNKVFIGTEECDECNGKFAATIEKDFFELLKPYRTLYGMKGKNGIPELNYKNNITITYNEEKQTAVIIDRGKCLSVDALGNLHLELASDTKVNLMNVYRCLVKFALSVIDNSELKRFSKTLDWMKNIKEDGSELSLPPVMILLDKINYFDQPEIVLYKRKTNDKQFPFLYAELKTCCFVYVYIIPFCSEDTTDFSKQENFDLFWNLNKHYKLFNRQWVKNYYNTDIVVNFKYSVNIMNSNTRQER